jgi:hypothetical protein
MSFFTRSAGNGWSTGKRRAPLDVALVTHALIGWSLEAGAI